MSTWIMTVTDGLVINVNRLLSAADTDDGLALTFEGGVVTTVPKMTVGQFTYKMVQSDSVIREPKPFTP